MARLARVVVPGYPHHVTQRGHHQQTVFFDDLDRHVYLTALKRNCIRYGLEVAGYCPMSNHVHLVVIPEREKSLAQAMGLTHNDYAHWQRIRQRRNGRLWQDRFYSCPLEEGHAWEALRYVELNPVRAGLTGRATEWNWSSARARVAGIDPAGLLEWNFWRKRWDWATWRMALETSVEDAEIDQRIRDASRYRPTVWRRSVR